MAFLPGEGREGIKEEDYLIIRHVALTLPIFLEGGGRCVPDGFGSRTVLRLGGTSLPACW